MQRDDRGQLDHLIQGYAASQLIYVAAKLGLADQLANGRLGSIELAARVGADHRTLVRVMRALVDWGVFSEPTPGHYQLTSMGNLLRRDVPDSLWSYAILGGDLFYRLWGATEYSVRTGQPASEQVLGQPLYRYLSSDPSTAEVFNTAMASDGDARVDALLAYDWNRCRHVVDIGGGNGYIIGKILRRFGHLRATLLDLPPAITIAEARFAADGLMQRAICVAGDFFSHVPNVGDTYVLANILHNWNDEDAIRILKNCSAAMGPRARLLVLDAIDSAARPAHWPDLFMLVLTGGRERTLRDWSSLMGAAALKIVDVKGDSLLVIERVSSS